MRFKSKRFILGGTGLAAAAATALVLATTGSGAAPNPVITTPNPVITAHIKSLVMTSAARMGDSTPTDISYSALVARNTALAASGEGSQVGPPYGQTPSYLVVAHGNFTAYDAMTPPGDNKYPTGTVLTMVVDAATGQPTDSGIQNNPPDMSAVGPVTVIPTKYARDGLTTGRQPTQAAVTPSQPGSVCPCGGVFH